MDSETKGVYFQQLPSTPCFREDVLQRLGLLDGTSVLELFILLEAHPRVLATVENDGTARNPKKPTEGQRTDMNIYESTLC